MSDNEKDKKLTQVWKSQATEGFRMSAAGFERRIAAAKRRARRERYVDIAAYVALILASITAILLGDYPASAWLYVVAWASFLVLLIRLPGMSASWLHSQPLVALRLIRRADPCIEWYRRDLQSRREVLSGMRTPWLIAGLVGLGLLLFVSGQGSSATRIPAFMGLATAAAAIVNLARSRREASRIQRAIEELNSFTGSAG